MKEKASVLRENILDAAIALFTEKGVEKVTTRELTHLALYPHRDPHAPEQDLLIN